MEIYSDFEKAIKLKFDDIEQITDDNLVEFIVSEYKNRFSENMNDDELSALKKTIMNELSLAFLSINKKMFDSVADMLEHVGGSMQNKIRKYQTTGNNLKLNKYIDRIFTACVISSKHA